MSVVSASDLFGNYRLPERKGRRSERGDLLQYFCERLNPARIASGYEPLSVARITYLTRYMTSLRDLYWLQSQCLDAESRGYSFSKRFWHYVRLQKSAQEIVDAEDVIHIPALAEISMKPDNEEHGLH